MHNPQTTVTSARLFPVDTLRTEALARLGLIVTHLAQVLRRRRLIAGWRNTITCREPVLITSVHAVFGSMLLLLLLPCLNLAVLQGTMRLLHGMLPCPALLKRL